MVETRRRNGLLHLFGRLQFGARVLVPKREAAVRTAGGQRPVHRMELDVVDGVDFLVRRRRVRAVALECEVVLFRHKMQSTWTQSAVLLRRNSSGGRAAPVRETPRSAASRNEGAIGKGNTKGKTKKSKKEADRRYFGGLRIDVLDGDTALDAAEGETGRQARLLVLEDGDAAVLVLERRLDALELLRRVVQLVQDQVPVGRRHHRERVLDVGAVAPAAERSIH